MSGYRQNLSPLFGKYSIGNCFQTMPSSVRDLSFHLAPLTNVLGQCHFIFHGIWLTKMHGKLVHVMHHVLQMKLMVDLYIFVGSMSKALMDMSMLLPILYLPHAEDVGKW